MIQGITLLPFCPLASILPSREGRAEQAPEPAYRELPPKLVSHDCGAAQAAPINTLLPVTPSRAGLQGPEAIQTRTAGRPPLHPACSSDRLPKTSCGSQAGDKGKCSCAIQQYCNIG